DPRGTLAIRSIAPNPVRAGATIHFDLAAPARVRLAVHDVRGRRVATIVDDAALDAGAHQVAVRTEGWPAGLYLCRLTAGTQEATRKVIVVRGN
ncbi:MAG: T9SS type A sorting domain-containing protein, partial [Candidatus Eisenbacteria bacterium]